MKSLLPLVKSYLKNSATVIQDIKGLTLPKEARLFTADATSMYTNIETNIGIESIRTFIQDNINYIPRDFPTDLFLEILEIVMTNNVFSFGNSYWLQLSGTAMGTPAACAYATISFGQHENSVILNKYKNNLLYFKRYIDDIFGIWLPPTTQGNAIWSNFKEDLNNWGSLPWVIKNPTSETNFLDLTIKIINSKISTTTYQKPLNLYLYLPPNSAHPPSCLKGLITGEIRRYWTQNSPEDFQSILTKFIDRLLKRGYTLPKLTPILLKAAATLNKSHSVPSTQNTDTLYLHWPFHPNGLNRQLIRRLYDNTLKPVLDYDNMQIAFSRPKNLRDLLSKSALAPTDESLVRNTLSSLINFRQQK